jgi:hypothetical protein
MSTLPADNADRFAPVAVKYALTGNAVCCPALNSAVSCNVVAATAE